MKTLKFCTMPSPVGMLKLVADDHKLLAILWDNERLNRVKLGEMEEDLKHSILLETKKQLNEYFSNQRKSFNLPLKANGTPFQEAVWEVLTQIPYGITLSYKEVAERIHQPNAVRAVGAAIGRNPISIIIPCHRVIATNGALTGFAGGLERKKTLLAIEKS